MNVVVVLAYLFCGIAIRSNEPVTLADDSRVHVTTNSIHHPMCVVIVHNMEEPKSTPWHSLNQSLPEVVEGQRYLHVLVLDVFIIRPEQHRLV